MSLRSVVSKIWIFKNSAIIILAPLLFLPLAVIGDSQIPKCGYVICIMAVYWGTEACPIPVTALLPTILFPLLGIQTMDTVCMAYMKDTNFLLIGTVAVCIAIEEWDIHKRFALRILLMFGSKACWLMLGLMIITAVLSMWLSNTATVALVYPITMAICNEIVEIEKKKTNIKRNTSELKVLVYADASENPVGDGDVRTADEDSSEDITENNDPVSEDVINLQKAMLVAVAYSSTLGGICTTVGTPTNFIALGIFSTTYDDKAEEVNFITWFAFCFPLSVITLILAWLWLQFRFLNIRDLMRSKSDESSEEVHAMLQRNYDSLPPMRFAEIAISAHFVLLILLWFFRDPKIFTGWKSFFPGSFAKDATAAALVGMSMFLFPSKASSFTWMWRKNANDVSTSKPLLEWKTFQRRFPWDILLLLGSGFALAGGCVDSGLSAWFGKMLTVLRDTPPWVITLVITVTISALTEFTSNTATASIFLPMLLPLSNEMKLNPILILLASALSASFAFSLPTATPPNAMLFSYGIIRVKDLILAGLPMNLICIFFLNISIPMIGYPLFGLGEMPEWAMSNATANSSDILH